MELARYLLEAQTHNVNVNALTTDHSLPIHFAVAYEHTDLVRLLLTRPVVVPSSVLDLDTTEEIAEMLEGNITLHYTTQHSTTLHYTTLHYTTTPHDAGVKETNVLSFS